MMADVYPGDTPLVCRPGAEQSMAKELWRASEQGDTVLLGLG